MFKKSNTYKHIYVYQSQIYHVLKTPVYIIYIYIKKHMYKKHIYIYLHFNLNSYEKTYTCKYYKVSSGCRML